MYDFQEARQSNYTTKVSGTVNYDQFTVLCANTCHFYKFTFKIFKIVKFLKVLKITTCFGQYPKRRRVCPHLGQKHKRSLMVAVQGPDYYAHPLCIHTLVNRGGNITAPKGSGTVFMGKSGQTSENITTVAACNVTVILPPMIISNGVRMDEGRTNGAAKDAVFATSPTLSTHGFSDSSVESLLEGVSSCC
jgi:hypothetical protein